MSREEDINLARAMLAAPQGKWTERTGETTWREVPCPYLLVDRGHFARLVDLADGHPTDEDVDAMWEQEQQRRTTEMRELVGP